MRGASALGDLLNEKDREDLRTYVVWVPVLASDDGPPSAATAAAVPDHHVRKRWDPELAISADAARAIPRTIGRPCREPTGKDDPDAITWDCVMVFDRGVRWEEKLPAPWYVGGPVVRVIGEARAAIDAP